MFHIEVVIIITVFVFLVSIQNTSFAQETNEEKHHTPNIKNPGIIIKFCANFDPGTSIDPYTIDAQKLFATCYESYDGYSAHSGILAVIYAPSWNTDPFKIDTIGNTEDNPISIYTDAVHKKLVGTDNDPINGFGECTGFLEVGPDSGLFAGRIGLSGYVKDYDGDGAPDASGVTNCGTGSPYGQRGANAVNLKTTSQGRVTLAWEVSENFTILKTATYSFMEASLQFDKEIYDVEEEIIVTLTDLDLRVGRGSERYWIIDAWSDSDYAGIELKAFFEKNPQIPFALDGTHKVKFYLSSEKESRDNFRLYVRQGDQIYIGYNDYTLPPPYGDEEFIRITNSSKVKISSLSDLSSQTEFAIPDWVRINAKWWSEDAMSDSDFISGIQFLIQSEIIRIPNLPEVSEKSEDGIPSWFKSNAKFWSDGKISDENFINGIKYLVEKGIIKVN